MLEIIVWYDLFPKIFDWGNRELIISYIARVHSIPNYINNITSFI